MPDYLILIADKGAVSFCHYNNEYYNKGEADLMPFTFFKKIIEFARSHHQVLNIILGREKLPDKYLKILNNTDYSLIVPAELTAVYPEAVPVFDLETTVLQPEDQDTKFNSIIIRLRGYPMKDLRKVIRRYASITRRINLIINDIQELTEESLSSYQHQLNQLVPLISSLYESGNSLEINCLSDRIILNKMNNCNAGIDHVTFAPNGKFYICPGFYHSHPQHHIGSLETGTEILNKELLLLKNAPICSACDAFHCRRCVYLNKITTHEMNTPSRQQCVLSHMERNASRSLFRRLRNSILNQEELSEIPEIDYLDPLDMLLERKSHNKIKIYRSCRREI